MKFTEEGIAVDSGTIIIADNDYFKKLRKRKKEDGFGLNAIIDVPKGLWEVSWRIPKTYNGVCKGTNLLRVTSGQVHISDPCYLIDDSVWSKWLDDTDYCKQLGSEQAFVIDSMGGDGLYTVHLNMREATC